MRILITGGTGSVGKAFLKKYYDLGNFEFGIVSRSSCRQYDLMFEYPSLKTYLCDVSDKVELMRVYSSFRPDIVVHLAAMKYIDLAENLPINAIKVNLMGSLNVIDSSIEFNVPITVATSTDKACESKSVYGQTKYLMERAFLEANSDRNKFAVCRFGNVAFSEGSVLPIWMKLKEEGKPLKITNPEMNRLMFSKEEAAMLIKSSINMCCNGDGGFILSKRMKSVNILELSKAISENREIVGNRPGEKLDEVLIGLGELKFSEVDGDFIKLRAYVNENIATRLKMPLSTLTAEVMTSEEIKKLIEDF